jgi:hypothetical protein
MDIDVDVDVDMDVDVDVGYLGKLIILGFTIKNTIAYNYK